MTLTVTEARTQKMSFSGSRDAISVNWHKDYFVDVTDVDPATIGPYDVLTATGIPVVNRTIYTIGNKIIPYVICRDKSAEQHPDRLARWTVKTKFKASLSTNSEESDNQPIDPPAALTDITPRVVPVLGEISKVIYEDKDGNRILTPTGNYWSEPVIERVPTLQLQVTQYESFLSYDAMLERMLKCNQKVYRNQPRYDWIIEDIQPTEVDIMLASGETTAAQVTYTVTHSPHLYGWKDDRSLIDTHYLDGSDKKQFRESDLRTQGIGLITSAGAKAADQTAIPDSVQFEAQDTIDFDTFLLA